MRMGGRRPSTFGKHQQQHRRGITTLDIEISRELITYEKS